MRERKPAARPFRPSWISILLAVAGFLAIQWYLSQGDRPKSIAYSALLQLVRDGKVKEVHVSRAEIHALLAAEEGGKPARVVAGRLPELDERRLVEELDRAGVVYSGRVEQMGFWQSLLLSLLPVAFFVGLSLWASVRAGKRMGPLSVGKSQVKIHDQSKDVSVSFDDVAGVDEAKAELLEVVDYLKAPRKYEALGAHVPKGVLLVGSPGTGKTLLARAVAGEAAVPFFSISGSEFVEMFVGVGAARVRDLFEQAKARAPCIVFIDELDAIGRTRGGVAAMGSHEEREQTLNQLLVEMDGFEAGTGVVIMAATNRPEILDRALVRAGRFDRQVVVDRPDVEGRQAILAVHAKKVKLAAAVDLKVVAQRTTGMVGADLANVVNEAALAAVRRGSAEVEQRDFEAAIDRIQLGSEKKSQAMSEEEKRRVAFHEGGHTLVAMSVRHADPVHRVTIIPRSIGALGVTLQLPTEDRYLVTREELEDRIAVMLGGRAAEEVVFGNASTGAANDLERATETARQMVTRFGMSELLGPQTFGRSLGARYLDIPGLGDERNYSEQTAREIDGEVRAIVDRGRARALELLQRRRADLDRLGRELLEHETLDRADLERLLGPAATAGASAA